MQQCICLLFLLLFNVSQSYAMASLQNALFPGRSATALHHVLTHMARSRVIGRVGHARAGVSVARRFVASSQRMMRPLTLSQEGQATVRRTQMNNILGRPVTFAGGLSSIARARSVASCFNRADAEQLKLVGKLARAIVGNHVDTARELLLMIKLEWLNFATIVEPVSKRCYGLLHYAARNGLLEIVKLLVHAGIGLNTLDSQNLSSFMNAVNNNDAPIACYLINQGCDVNFGHADYIHFYTNIIHYLVELDTIASRQILSHLIKKGRFKIGVIDESGRTPIVRAVNLKKSHDMLNTLINLGADTRGLNLLYGPEHVIHVP